MEKIISNEYQDIWGVVNQWFIVLTNQAQLTQTQKDNLDSKKTKKTKGFKGSLLHLLVDRTTFLRNIAYATTENGAWDIVLNALKGVEKE